MENAFLGFSFSSNLISDAPNNKINSPLLFEYEALDTSLGLNSRRTSNLCSSSSNVSKRRLNEVNEKEFLSLGLGLPFSPPAKETSYEDSCMNSVPDLNLSLSICPSESIISSTPLPTIDAESSTTESSEKSIITGATHNTNAHGGGPRCQFLGCGRRSAQGCTDFCKAHGGGRRCLWGRGCDRLGRGRAGMCAAHGGLVLDFCVRGGSAVGVGTVERMEDVSVPEGRVHGGSFLAFLSNDANAGRFCSL